MTASAEIAGIVLAGGRSSRMGGRDKVLLPRAGRPLLARVIDRLAPQVGQFAINADRDPSRFVQFCLPVLADPVEGLTGLRSQACSQAWNGRRANPGFHGSQPLPATHRCFHTTSCPAWPKQPKPAATTPSWPLPPATGIPSSRFGRSRCGMAWCFFWPPIRSARSRPLLRCAARWSWIFPPAGPAGHTFDPFLNINTPTDLEEAEALWHDFTT